LKNWEEEDPSKRVHWNRDANRGWETRASKHAVMEAKGIRIIFHGRRKSRLAALLSQGGSGLGRGWGEKGIRIGVEQNTGNPI